MLKKSMALSKKEKFKSNHNVSPDMFKSRFLNALTRTHISIPLTIFYGSGFYLYFFSPDSQNISVWPRLALFLIGVFIFTFVEYNMHRFVYHNMSRANWAKKLAYTVHGVHHDYPKDKMRLALPPWLSVLVAYVVVVFFQAVFQNNAHPIAAGFMFGYATYLLIHYSVHIFPVPKNFLSILWKNHTLHHYKHTDKLFGVSSPLWDYIYRTYEKK